MSATPSAARCARCLFPARTCVCAAIPAVPTRTRILILRHHTEAARASNTGRLAHLALPNSVIVEHGVRDTPDAIPDLTDRNAYLLFPGGPPRTSAPVPPPSELVVLDGTWAQARRMYQKIDALRGLPMLRLPDAPMPAARLRASPGPGQVSTIEAIARALRLLEGEDVAEPLERLFDVAVRHARASG